jgi:hypothetical protein
MAVIAPILLRLWSTWIHHVWVCTKFRSGWSRSLESTGRNLFTSLTPSDPIFLPTAYSPALICFGWERGRWITCNYPTVLKEKNMEKQEEYNLRCLLAKVRTTWGKASDRLWQRVDKRNKNRVGHLPTSEQKGKVTLSDEVRRGIGKGYIKYDSVISDFAVFSMLYVFFWVIPRHMPSLGPP